MAKILNQSLKRKSTTYAGEISESAKELGYIVTEAKQISGGEDFSLYQTKIPGFFIWVGVEGDKDWHHPLNRCYKKT